MLSIGVAQMTPRLGDLQANLSQCERYVARAREHRLDVLVFPELNLTGYHLRDMVAAVALRLDAPEMTLLKEWSREVALVVGLVEESADYRFYNAAAYIADGEIRHVHRKVYLPTYGACLMNNGILPAATVYAPSIFLGDAVRCSSSPLRGIADREVQDDNARYWELVNRMYVETFGVFLIYANRVGFEDGVGFWGGSEILDPFGRRLAKGKYYEEDFISAGLSLDAVRRKRIASPLLRDEDIGLTINELMRIRGR